MQNQRPFLCPRPAHGGFQLLLLPEPGTGRRRDSGAEWGQLGLGPKSRREILEFGAPRTGDPSWERITDGCLGP